MNRQALAETITVQGGGATIDTRVGSMMCRPMSGGVGYVGAMEPEESTTQQVSTERQLARARADMLTLAQQNERLAKTLNQAKAQMVEMKERLDALGQPPLGFGIVLEIPQRKPTDMVASADVYFQGRRMRLKISAQTEDADIQPGFEVMINETMVIVGVRPHPAGGDIVTVDDVLDPPSVEGAGEQLRRAVVTGSVDTQHVVLIAPSIAQVLSLIHI